MDIRAKFYPYPVLSHFADDYIGSEFKTSINVEKAGHNILMRFSSEVKDDGLIQLISSAQARFVYHLECSQTGYRKALSTADRSLVHIVLNGVLAGKLQICPFVVAVVDINGYANENFNPDYRGFKFDIEAGCVLAVGQQVDVQIDKERSYLLNTRSVFSIIKNDDPLGIGMLVDFDYNRIIVKLPETDFNNLQSLRGEAIVQSVINSLVVTPALVYVLEEVSKRDSIDRYEYESYSWYRSIKRSLRQNFDCDIESADFAERNMLELAQNLINCPISDALQTLSSGYSGFNEGEEEE